MRDVKAAIVSSLGERYAIERELGKGGMAVVYLAFDRRHHRPVALKVLHPELDAELGVQRFVREIEIAARLNHPHILPVLDSGSVRVDDATELPFYVMPYVPGETLRARLRRERQLSVFEAVRLAREVADALGHAHEQGVVHRDIKPENILLSGGHAVVSDFGVARALTVSVDDSRTVTGVSIGTPQYMSPEQVLGERDIDGRSDLYALGCVLYEMLAGEPPFAFVATNVVLARQLAGEVPSLRTARPAVPVALERAITRALAKAPADRFHNAQEFIAELDLQQESRGDTRTRRRPFLVAAGVVVAAALTGILVLRGGNASALNTNLIAVAPFDVLGRSGDLSLWREGMVDLLSRNLDGAGPLRTVSPTAVIRGWSGRAHAASAAELARRTGAGLIVFGQLRQSGGDSLRLVATLMDATTGASASEFEFRGEIERADLLADSLTLGLLAELGRERVIQTLRLRGGSRAPLPALKSFLQGEQLFRRASWDSALISYERAIALDSAFTFALYRAGTVLAWQRLDSDSLSSAYR
ncbi:MAG: serine/threonine-protein kinase, partial [Longimicrobiales bacterium]